MIVFTAGIGMISKIFDSARQALADVPDGACIMVGGFGLAGQPKELIDALLDQGAKDLVIVNNNAGNGETGLAALLAAGRVRKIVCSRSEEHTSELQSLMRISYAVFCLKKKKEHKHS